MMINNENHRLIRVSDIDIITITEAGGIYAVLHTATPAFDIMVVNCGDMKSKPMETDSLYVTECQTFNRLNIQERSLEGLCKYIVGNFPHLKYRPEFKFNPKETADGVLDFVWMSDRVYDDNVELSKRQPNAYGWLPVDEKDVIGLRLFDSPVTLFKSTFKRSEDFSSDIKVDDVFILSNVSLDQRSIKSEPLASGFCHIEYFGKDPDKSFYRVELRRAVEYEATNYEHPYYLVLRGVDMAADTFIGFALNAVSMGIGDEDAFIGKFLQCAVR